MSEPTLEELEASEGKARDAANISRDILETLERERDAVIVETVKKITRIDQEVRRADEENEKYYQEFADASKVYWDKYAAIAVERKAARNDKIWRVAVTFLVLIYVLAVYAVFKPQ